MKPRTTFKRACEMHDEVWARYVKAVARARIDRSFKAQQAVIDLSHQVERAQARIGEHLWIAKQAQRRFNRKVA